MDRVGVSWTATAPRPGGTLPGLRPPTRAGTSARDDHTQHRAGGGSPSSPRFLHALLPAFDSLMSGACSGVAASVFCRVRLKTVTWAVAPTAHTRAVVQPQVMPQVIYHMYVCMYVVLSTDSGQPRGIPTSTRRAPGRLPRVQSPMLSRATRSILTKTKMRRARDPIAMRPERPSPSLH